MKPEMFDAFTATLAEAGVTRRAAAAMAGGAAASLLGVGTETAIEAKKKRKRKKRRRKNKHKHKNKGGGLSKPPHVAVGIYMPRALDSASVMNGLNKSLGRSPDYVIWYETWSMGNFNNNHRQYLQTIDERNLTPVISWDPFDPDGPTIDQPEYRLSKIHGGDFNGYIDSWAEGLADYGKPVYLAFAHEMNGDWFPWGVGVNGNSGDGGDFVAAWRHIHDRFRDRGANNVRWVWIANKVYDTIPAALHEVYPGDGYVDWVGMNGYNWGTAIYWESCPCRSWWESFGKVFSETYHELTALTNKPIMIGETASAEKGGKKDKWIKNALLSALPNNYPQVRAVTWFNAKATGLDTNEDGEVVPTGTVDWRYTSSKEARQAFSRAVKNDYYRASLRDI